MRATHACMHTKEVTYPEVSRTLVVNLANVGLSDINFTCILIYLQSRVLGTAKLKCASTVPTCPSSKASLNPFGENFTPRLQASGRREELASLKAKWYYSHLRRLVCGPQRQLVNRRRAGSEVPGGSFLSVLEA